MTFDEFKESLKAETPPVDLDDLLLAMWRDGRGDWQGAHDLVDHRSDQKACHVHAYLHRKEGDMGNAAYWYRRAGKPVSHQSLSEEWEAISKLLL